MHFLNSPWRENMKTLILYFEQPHTQKTHSSNYTFPQVLVHCAVAAAATIKPGMMGKMKVGTSTTTRYCCSSCCYNLMY